MLNYFLKFVCPKQMANVNIIVSNVFIKSCLAEDKQYDQMLLELTFGYPSQHYKDYTVKLNIGFVSAMEQMVYTLKHRKSSPDR